MSARTWFAALLRPRSLALAAALFAGVGFAGAAHAQVIGNFEDPTLDLWGTDGGPGSPALSQGTIGVTLGAHSLRSDNAQGGFWGLLAGTLASIGLWAWVRVDHSALARVALSSHAQDMAENMFRALWSWLVCVAVTVLVS